MLDEEKKRLQEIMDVTDGPEEREDEPGEADGEHGYQQKSDEEVQEQAEPMRNPDEEIPEQIPPVQKPEPSREQEDIRSRFVLPQKYRPSQREAGDGEPSRLPLILSVIAVVISIIALAAVFLVAPPAGSAISQEELKAIAEDVRAIRDSHVEILSQTETSTTMEAEIPVSDAMDQKLQIPLSTEIPVSGSVSGTSPWGTVVQVPVSGTIPIHVVANLTLGRTSQKIVVSTSFPTNSTTSFALSPSDHWKKELDDIIERLERLGG